MIVALFEISTLLRDGKATRMLSTSSDCRRHHGHVACVCVSLSVVEVSFYTVHIFGM